MDGQMEKPILLRLNEVSKINKVELQWQTLSEEGPPHSRTFTMQLVIGSETYQGAGQSKKKAQIIAAEACLLNTTLTLPPAKVKPSSSAITAMDDTAPFDSLKRPLEAENECSNGAKKIKVEDVEMGIENAVSTKPPLMAVYEMARFNNIDISFTIANETGPPHCKTFEAVLKLGDETYNGSGTSHKKAQTMCAEGALQQTQYKHPVPTAKAKPKKQKKTDAAEGEESSASPEKKDPEEEFVLVKGVKLPTQVFKVPDGQGGPYFCSICNVHLNSFQQLKQHLESTKHDRKQNPQNYHNQPEFIRPKKTWGKSTGMAAKKPIGKSFVRGGYLDRARPENQLHGGGRGGGGGSMHAPFYSGNEQQAYQQWNPVPPPVPNTYGSRTTGYGYTVDQYENANNYSGGYNQDTKFSSYSGGYSAPQGAASWNMQPTGVPPPPGSLVQNDYHNSEHSNAWN